MPKKFDQEFKARAVRLVRDQREHFPTKSAAIAAVAAREGVGSETLRSWVRQIEIDDGVVAGTSSADAQRIRELEARVAELQDTVDVLSAATTFFAGALDPRTSRAARSRKR